MSGDLNVRQGVGRGDMHSRHDRPAMVEDRAANLARGRILRMKATDRNRQQNKETKNSLIFFHLEDSYVVDRRDGFEPVITCPTRPKHNREYFKIYPLCQPKYIVDIPSAYVMLYHWQNGESPEE